MRILIPFLLAWSVLCIGAEPSEQLVAEHRLTVPEAMQQTWMILACYHSREHGLNEDGSPAAPEKTAIIKDRPRALCRVGETVVYLVVNGEAVDLPIVDVVLLRNDGGKGRVKECRIYFNGTDGVTRVMVFVYLGDLLFSMRMFWYPESGVEELSRFVMRPGA